MSRTMIAPSTPSSFGSEPDTTQRFGPISMKTREKATPLWRTHNEKAQKSGQRGAIYWVGKALVGEDAAPTGQRAKGASYYGEWNDNKKSGYGVQTFPNGQKYEGQWAGGLRNGEGTLWIPVGKSGKLRKLYVGGWRDDRRHGKGTCFFKNGEFFQGEWDGGMMHGQGQLRYENGDLYVGEWHQGQRSGQGTLNKANGDCYEGYWLNDKREGSGSYFYASSGKVFVGEWANDLPKAGVYTQAHANPEQAAAVPTTTTLPPVRLALPAEVLEGALAAVRNARKAHRAKSTPVQRLFSQDEMRSLMGAFTAVGKNNETRDDLITPSQVQELCASLGATVTQPRLRRLLGDAGLFPDDPMLRIGFEQFLRVIALLLDEESAAANADAMNDPLASADDIWDELDVDAHLDSEKFA